MKEAHKTESFNEKQLRAIMDNTVDGIIVINSQGTILSFNRACETLFGYTSDEVIGKNVNVLMPNPYHAQHDKYLSNYLHSRDPKIIGIGREVAGTRKDATQFPMWLSIGEVIEDENHFFVGIIRDFTQQKRNESQVKKYMLELEQSNRYLDDFVYIVSHDLKEPVRGLYSYSQFMIEDYGDRLDEAGKTRLRSLMKLSKRMDDLIDKLLYFSRLNKTSLSYAEMDINEIIREVLDMIEPYIEEQNADVQIDKNFPVLLCDQARVGEIFRNLITNAVKYNDKDKKTVQVGFMKHPQAPGKTTFYVRDNGIGIPEKHFDSVFKMFKRLHGRDAYGGGTGSGLTITKSIINQHGGDIWIESTPNEGTCFYFTLEKSY